MKIQVYKENDDIVTKLVIDKMEEQFDYVKLINKLYEGEKIDKTDFDENVDEWERNEIQKLIDEIVLTIENKKKEQVAVD